MYFITNISLSFEQFFGRHLEKGNNYMFLCTVSIMNTVDFVVVTKSTRGPDLAFVVHWTL